MHNHGLQTIGGRHWLLVAKTSSQATKSRSYVDFVSNKSFLHTIPAQSTRLDCHSRGIVEGVVEII